MGGEFFLVAFLLIMGMGAYWVFVLMPRQRNFSKRQQMARSLAAGDEVVVTGIQKIFFPGMPVAPAGWLSVNLCY